AGVPLLDGPEGVGVEVRVGDAHVLHQLHAQRTRQSVAAGGGHAALADRLHGGLLLWRQRTQVILAGEWVALTVYRGQSGVRLRRLFHFARFGVHEPRRVAVHVLHDLVLALVDLLLFEVERRLVFRADLALHECPRDAWIVGFRELQGRVVPLGHRPEGG